MRHIPLPTFSLEPAKTPWNAALLVIAAALVHLLWWQISEPPTLFSDFYKAYFPAAEYLWEDGLRAPWPFTETGAGGFVNIPLVAWLFLPFVPLGEELAGWVFLVINAAATLLAWIGLVRLADAKPLSGIGIALMLLVLVNGPLVNSLREGNTTQFVLLALVSGSLLLRSGKPFLAGVVIGASALLKLPMLLVLAYFVWKRRWHTVAGAATSIGIMAGASVLVFGLDSHFNWFQCCVDPFLRGVIPAFNVQSIDGFIVRLETGASRLREWDPLARTTAHQLARIACVGSALAICYAVMRRDHSPATTPAPSGRDGGSYLQLLDVGIMVVLAVICSPVSWTHYYLLLLLPWSLLLGEMLSPGGDWRVRTLTLTSMVLAALPVLDVPAGPELMREILARTLISSWLFGGIAALSALLLVRRRGYTLAGSLGHERAIGSSSRDAPLTTGCTASGGADQNDLSGR